MARISRSATISRADQIRQKRVQESEKRQQHARSSVETRKYEAVIPPVTTRGGYGTPVARRAATQPRRPISVPMGRTGVEMLLPSLPIVKPGWRLLSGSLVVALSFLLFYVLSAPQFRVDEAAISGLKRVDATDVNIVLGLRGSLIFSVNPVAVSEQIIKAFPELTDVSITVGLPAVVKVEAREREPIMIWQWGERSMWVDEQGLLFPIRGETEAPLFIVVSDSLPPLVREINPDESFSTEPEPLVLTPEGSGQRMVPDILAAARTLSTEMPEGTPLIYDHVKGLGWQDPAGWDVYLGRSVDNLDQKMLMYQAVVDYINQQGIVPAVISVAQVDAPYYRMER
ncbi:MAG: hypothetical protein HPY76_11125 [Anaerolineae bacterium]|nr:hypothetical protein [Anaerolineae bacterium]